MTTILGFYLLKYYIHLLKARRSFFASIWILDSSQIENFTVQTEVLSHNAEQSTMHANNIKSLQK